MKKLYILSLILIGLLASSCEKEEDRFTILPLDQVTKPILQQMGELTISEADLDEGATKVFTWTKADYGVPSAPQYSLYAQKEGNDPVLISGTSSSTLEIGAEDLNKVLINMGIEPNSPQAVTFFVEASISNSYVVKSEPISVQVTTYKPNYPDNVYMIGKEFGDWNWSSPDIIELRADKDVAGKFYTIFTVQDPSNGFKWNTVKAWGGDFFSLGNDSGFTTKDGNAFVAEAGTYKVIVDFKTNAITIEPTTETLFPENVYMIGQEFGGWDWANSNVVEMTPVNGTPGKFWAIRYFSDANNGFKWNTTKAWGGDFFSLGTDNGFTTKDGNAYVAEPGLYSVLVDYTTNSITIAPAKVFGMGDSFGGWNAGEYPFVVDGNLMKIKTTNTAEIRMYADIEAAGVGDDWWRMEFVFFDDKIAYRGNGGDQERVVVDAGKEVILDFNAGTAEVK